MSPEEKVECIVEPVDVFAVVHQKAAQSRAYVGPAADARPLERAQRVDEPSVMNIQAAGAQQTSEQEHVVRQRFAHHAWAGPLASARFRSAGRRSPRIEAMSSWFFRRIPSVSSTVCGSSRSQLRATSAAAQSRVSDTPVRL